VGHRFIDAQAPCGAVGHPAGGRPDAEADGPADAGFGPRLHRLPVAAGKVRFVFFLWAIRPLGLGAFGIGRFRVGLGQVGFSGVSG
jgi:hypothetical protein